MTTGKHKAQGRRIAKTGSARILAARQAGPDHQVLTVKGDDRKRHRRKPCKDCPWRKDATGVFPAEAFRHSANTAHDMSQHVFACHQAGAEQTSVCAGFLLKGANHNLAIRLRRMSGEIGDDVGDGGYELHDSYRAMAIANGVPADDPALTGCRDD